MKFHNFNKVNPSILLGLEMATPDRREWPCLTKEYIRGSCIRETDATMDWLVFQLIVIMAQLKDYKSTPPTTRFWRGLWDRT